MSVFRFSAWILAAASLALAGCKDTRREAIRNYLQSHPPQGFEVAEIQEEFTIAEAADGTSETVVTVRCRLIRPTVILGNALDLPRGREISERIAAIRSWAIASLPAGDPTRNAIISVSARAGAPIPAKRIATPVGTEIESSTILQLHRKSGGWQVNAESFSGNVPGVPDENPEIPFENSPSITTALDEVEAVARQLEKMHEKYLADRRRAADRSLAALRSRLKTGHVFEGRRPDQVPVRLVIARGVDAGESVVAVLVVQTPEESSVRYVGNLVQLPSGDYVWRSARTTPLSGKSLAENGHPGPTFTLIPSAKGLTASLGFPSGKPEVFELSAAENADLIPDPFRQDSQRQ